MYSNYSYKIKEFTNNWTVEDISEYGDFNDSFESPTIVKEYKSTWSITEIFPFIPRRDIDYRVSFPKLPGTSTLFSQMINNLSMLDTYTQDALNTSNSKNTFNHRGVARVKQRLLMIRHFKKINSEKSQKIIRELEKQNESYINLYPDRFI